jgi:hypothetical protein
LIKKVPLLDVHTSDKQLEMLVSWLKSYDLSKCFTSHQESKVISDLVTSILPSERFRLGMLKVSPFKIAVGGLLGCLKESLGGIDKIIVPDWTQSSFKRGESISAMKALGRYEEMPLYIPKATI